MGDGGGENEGHFGAQHLLQEDHGDFAPRRCFGHIPWRVADACLDSMGEHHTKLKAVCMYLRDGSTWTRFRAIAVQPRDLGGIQLLVDGSKQFQDVFAVAPPLIVDERPETVATFLSWLIPKENVLSALAKRDFELRNLSSKQFKVAEQSLQCMNDRVYRAVNLSWSKSRCTCSTISKTNRISLSMTWALRV